MRWRPSRAILVLAVIALLLVVLLATVLAPALGRRSGLPIPSMYSSQPGGTRALALWLRELGYRVESNGGQPFEMRNAQALFVLAPSLRFTESQADAVAGWVERGGTLVFAPSITDPLADRFGLRTRTGATRILEAFPIQPLLIRPKVRRVVFEPKPDFGLAALPPMPPRPFDTRIVLSSDWVPLLGDANSGEPVAALLRRGRGRVVALATPWPLTNDAIGAADNAAFALHLLSGVPAGSLVQLDEYHHGLTEHGTLLSRLVGEPWGWAALYVTALAFTFLALAGRRFGRVATELVWEPPRVRAEYVQTVAAMLRQGGHVDWLRQQYVGQFRRALRGNLRADATELEPVLDRLEGAEDERALVGAMRQAALVRARLLGSSE